MLFALIREGVAGPLLMVAAFWMHRERFDWRVAKDARGLPVEILQNFSDRTLP